MNKNIALTFAIGLLIIQTAILLSSECRAQQSTYYTDRWGQPVGQAWTYGNQTFYSDAIGRPMGSAATNGNQPPAPLGMPYPLPVPVLRIEPIRPIEPIQPLRLQ